MTIASAFTPTNRTRKQTNPTEIADARADWLLTIGLDIAVRIRDEAPNDVALALAGLTHTDMRDLVVLLAACVPVDQPRSSLTAWYRPLGGAA